MPKYGKGSSDFDKAMQDVGDFLFGKEEEPEPAPQTVRNVGPVTVTPDQVHLVLKGLLAELSEQGYDVSMLFSEPEVEALKERVVSRLAEGRI